MTSGLPGAARRGDALEDVRLRAPSSRSGGSRRARARRRRGSTRRRARGRGSAGRSRSARAPPWLGRRPRRPGGRGARAAARVSSATASSVSPPARAGRALDQQRVAVEVVVALERLDEQVVQREPHRPAPVRVAAEEARVGLARQRSGPGAARLRGAGWRGGRGGTSRASARRTGDRNSRSSSTYRSTRSRRSRVGMARSRCSSFSSGCMHAMVRARSGLFSRNHSSRARKSGSDARCSASSDSTANSGMSPTIERTRSGTTCPSTQRLVVVEAVLLVPEPGPAELVHRRGDADEVLEELRGDVGVRRVLARELERDREHRGAVERHPGRGVGLLQPPAPGQRLRAVEEADVVEARGSRP